MIKSFIQNLKFQAKWFEIQNSAKIFNNLDRNFFEGAMGQTIVRTKNYSSISAETNRNSQLWFQPESIGERVQMGTTDGDISIASSFLALWRDVLSPVNMVLLNWIWRNLGFFSSSKQLNLEKSRVFSSRSLRKPQNRKTKKIGEKNK